VSQVAQIFRLNGDEVQRNVSVSGKIIDISTSTSAGLGRPKHITYINCVHDHKVTWNEANDFKNTINNARKATV
jgi:hypothetical protein